MRHHFVLRTLRRLLDDKLLAADDTVLAVCASTPERDVFLEAGIRSVTISNLDARLEESAMAPFAWSYQDAQSLTFGDKQFDHVFVSDGLHHCQSPHKALLEMLRVAKKSIIVFESRDSLFMRLACRFGLARDYEVEAVVGSGCVSGGMNNSAIPNYVYRWTEREFEKSLFSYQPTAPCNFLYFYGMNLPSHRLSMQTNSVRSTVVSLLSPFIAVFGRVFPSQSNSFCMVAEKARHEVWPWVQQTSSGFAFRETYAHNFRRTS